MDKVGLVLGILSLVGGSIPGVNAFPMWLFGVAGIITCTFARKKQKSGMATIGLILSIIGTILAASLWLACAVCVGATAVSGLNLGLN
jgi:hypothetical protein